MGGIAGRFNFRTRAPVVAATIQGMCDLLAHRGPDGHGVFVEGPVGLGHRRLAILDLSDAGRQPMCTPDGNLSITFDGEIYNFIELRADLGKRGHHFRSGTDTEVLLAAYRQWGVGSIERLRGMFAFAIWDRNAHTLLVARDRLGKKPLHYWLDNDGLAFASEPKAFLAESGFDPAPDVEAISHYLSYQHVPSPTSAFENVRKLPPAHYMLVAAGRIRTERYWELRHSPKHNVTEGEACEELLARLTGAVRLRLASDVPLGALLDGGIDSSAIVALAAAQRGSLKTFSIGFGDEDDEGPNARAIVEHYSTDHHHDVVRPDARDIIPKLVWHYGEPFADRSAIATYYLSQLARRHVTVALNGSVGGEVFGDHARPGPTGGLGRACERLPAIVRQMVHSLVSTLSTFDRPAGWLSRGKRWTELLAMSAEERYTLGMMRFPPSLKELLCTPEFTVAATRDSREMLLDEFRRTDATDRDMLLHADVKRYLPDVLLVKVDIASMAHGLESRCPLLDHELMEFVAAMPVDFTRRGANTKCIFKRVVKPLLLPPRRLDRTSKGVGVPLDRWFRHELREMAYGLLLDRRTIERGYFHAYVIKRMLDEHVRHIHNWADQLWSLLMLELWHRAFTDARVAASVTNPIG